MVRSSIQPRSRSRSAKAAIHGLMVEGSVVPRKPIVGSFPGCCALAATGQTAAAPPTSVMNSRRLMLNLPFQSRFTAPSACHRSGGRVLETYLNCSEWTKAIAGAAYRQGGCQHMHAFRQPTSGEVGLFP